MSIASYLTAELTGVEVISPDAPDADFNLKMASDDMFSLLSPLFPEIDGIKQVFPATTVESRNYPDAVFNIASGPVQKVYKNTVIAYTTLYDVVIRDTLSSGLLTQVGLVEDAIDSNAGYQRVDSADDYLEDENAYRMGLNIEVSRPVSSDMSTIPDKSLIISVDSWNADPNTFNNCTRQRKNYNIAIISTATSKAYLEAMRADTQALLMGWTESANHTRMEMVQGEILQADAGLYSAVDVYTNSETIVKSDLLP